MCKFCDGSETPLARQETDHRDAEIRIDGKTLIADLRHDYLTAEIDFCPKCGTPLGEVKPLTVEQIAELNKAEQGKPLWIAHGKDGLINKSRARLSEICFNPNDAGYVKQWSFGNEVEQYLKIAQYGTDWLAFDREPKGASE